MKVCSQFHTSTSWVTFFQVMSAPICKMSDLKIDLWIMKNYFQHCLLVEIVFVMFDNYSNFEQNSIKNTCGTSLPNNGQYSNIEMRLSHFNGPSYNNYHDLKFLQVQSWPKSTPYILLRKSLDDQTLHFNQRSECRYVFTQIWTPIMRWFIPSQTLNSANLACTQIWHGNLV